MAHRSQHLIGTATEYRVASYLLYEGYEVYWPADQHGQADFVIFKDGEFQKVQVKTAAWVQNGRNEYLSVSLSYGVERRYAEGDFDLLAISSHEGHIWLIPWEEVPGHHVALGKRGPTVLDISRTDYDPDDWRVK